jgi:hypothetical protein
MAEIYRKGKSFNGMIAHMDGVNAVLRGEAERLQGIAQGRLQSARAATRWRKYDRASAGETKIEVTEADGKYTSDYHVSMVAPNAVAIEYGHAPSGILAGTTTDSPAGLYIMTGTHIQA